MLCQGAPLAHVKRSQAEAGNDLFTKSIVLHSKKKQYSLHRRQDTDQPGTKLLSSLAELEQEFPSNLENDVQQNVSRSIWYKQHIRYQAWLSTSPRSF